MSWKHTYTLHFITSDYNYCVKDIVRVSLSYNTVAMLKQPWLILSVIPLLASKATLMEGGGGGGVRKFS